MSGTMSAFTSAWPHPCFLYDAPPAYEPKNGGHSRSERPEQNISQKSPITRRATGLLATVNAKRPFLPI